MLYKLVHAGNIKTLEHKVMAAIAEGWALQGGIGIDAFEPDTIYYQAMISGRILADTNTTPPRHYKDVTKTAAAYHG